MVVVTGEPPYDWISLQEAVARLGIYHRTLLKRMTSAATYLGLGETAFRTIVRRGEIAHSLAQQRGRLHGWRFTDVDLHRWLEERARVRPGDLRHLDTAADHASHSGHRCAGGTLHHSWSRRKNIVDSLSPHTGEVGWPWLSGCIRWPIDAGSPWRFVDHTGIGPDHRADRETRERPHRRVA